MENEEMNTKLQVVSEDGKLVTIDVIDIFSLDGEDTEYIIYSIDNNIYASILFEDEETYELQTIENKEDYAKVMARIDELIDSGE